MYDAIIVGARCAGSPLAMLLARRGHRVLLLDRATFPSDTISTHFIQIPGMGRMARWGVLDDVMATGCPAITQGLVSMDGQVLEAELPPPKGLPGNAAPRRTVLDKVLVDAAVDAGAELREGVMIDDLVIEEGRVVGVTGHTSSEKSFTERARTVVGADGRNSIVARSAGADFREHTPALGGGLYSYWSDVDVTGAEIYFHENAFTVSFPTNDGLTLIAIATPPDRFADMRREGEAGMLAFLDRMGTIGERTRAGTRAHDLIPVTGLANFIRDPWGPGWALVGDAVYHKDPTPADGIADAFRGVDLLADALDDVFAERSSEAEALGRYETTLEAHARPLLDKTLTMASFDSTAVDRGTAFLEIQGMHAEEVTALSANSV